MCFCLTNASAAFMDLMNRVFWNYLDSFVIVFIDDILVYSKNEGDHMGHLRVVFQTLNEINFFPNIASVSFGWGQWYFFWQIISSEVVEVDPRKTEVVKIGLDHWLQLI